MEEQNNDSRPNYLPALAFVGVLIGFQNLAIRSDSTPDPFLRPALSVTQAFRLPPELRPAELSYKSFPEAATSTLAIAVPDPGQFEEIDTAYEDWGEPPGQRSADSVSAAIRRSTQRRNASVPVAVRTAVSDNTSAEDPGSVIEEANRELELAATEPSKPAPPVLVPAHSSIQVAPRSARVAPAPAPTQPKPVAIPVLRNAAKATPKKSKNKKKTYIVQRGDTLYGIARRFEMPVATLVSRNSHIGDINNLSPGTKLTMAGPTSLTHKVESGESLWSIARFYDLAVGEVLAANNLAAPTIYVNQTLRIPTSSLSTAKLELAMRKRRARKRGFMMPVFGRTTDHFGMRRHPILRRLIPHRGLDIAAATGAPIRATQAGQVTFSGWLQGYGNLLEIRHRNGITSRYGHCSKLLKKKGSKVTKGELVAKVGKTGLATAPHLHFEIRKQGTPKDPLKFL